MQDPGIFNALKAARLSGMSYTSPVQIEELNARIRRMASTMRLIDPDTELRLQIEEYQQTPQRTPSQPQRRADQHRDSSAMSVAGGRRIFESGRMIQKAVFPGVNPPPSLPHSASSPRKLIAKAAQSCRANRRVRAKLLLPETERMLCDVFWHVFLTHTQPTVEKEAKDELFARIAASYVHVLLKTDSRDRNDLSFVSETSACSLSKSWQRSFGRNEYISLDVYFGIKRCDCSSIPGKLSGLGQRA
ncbi:hypothetical protein HDU86_007155 [Geranomyces michiganensis]|nr:hypothetical protein HDU86_007155 [Geranomyces michiganensis]